MGFPGDASGKESTCKCRRLRDMVLIPVSMDWEDFPREGHGNPLQYSCLENLLDRETWQPTIHDVAKNRTRLSDNTKKLVEKQNGIAKF